MGPIQLPQAAGNIFFYCLLDGLNRVFDFILCCHPYYYYYLLSPAILRDGPPPLSDGHWPVLPSADRAGAQEHLCGHQDVSGAEGEAGVREGAAGEAVAVGHTGLHCC